MRVVLLEFAPTVAELLGAYLQREVLGIELAHAASGPQDLVVVPRGSRTNGQFELDLADPQSLQDLVVKLRTGHSRLRESRANYDRSTAREKPRLTSRERQIGQMVAHGLTNREIADEIGVREQSVKNVVTVLLRKLDCRNRTELSRIVRLP
ncbi:MAG: helix-turn-helix transcriptional regulator [Fimbriimonadaceae bacterium]|nr:helix-turn-helix transcriptional regulator [Fimbriimonadaceae bacterium]